MGWTRGETRQGVDCCFYQRGRDGAARYGQCDRGRKKNSATYREQFKAAFGDERVDQARIALAILTYLTSITTGRSRYDVFIGGDKSALTATERHGLEIFSRPCKTPRPRMNTGFAALQQGRRSLTIGLSASDSWEFYRWPTPRTPTSSGSPWPR
ncbi:cytochrome c peroxidase [Xanthomonas oryzae]|uniref:cytochrome c peroxidase n=1 Tax=Xanthomonas oryzae TaxID=347 RepID=UPI0024411282|nr:cytochrome c peroxidase [Xanthomonas oryzae]